MKHYTIILNFKFIKAIKLYTVRLLLTIKGTRHIIIFLSILS